MNYHLLGRTGLRIAPLALGTMTFGEEWGWGSSEDGARQVFNAYCDAGGNFLDTADMYTMGSSETLLGKFVRERNCRDFVVIATKYTFNAQPGNPNAGGNGRKNMLRAVEGSLRRLGTDYIDLYWVHAWDGMTPVEETMHGLNALVESGKVRYIGLSDCPAWYVSRAQTLAEIRGWERLAGVQMEYNLIERNIENEFVPMVVELGMGIVVWSPLASGFLTGKYTRDTLDIGRLGTVKDSGNPVFERITRKDRNWEIEGVLRRVAQEVGRPAAQVALNWITKRPGVSAVLVGAKSVDQLQSNLQSLDFEIPPELSSQLEAASRPESVTPYMFFGPEMRGMQTGGTMIAGEPAWMRRTIV
jgi:aryl-alcohol dehydrogenase-like predicted oxidoreductase